MADAGIMEAQKNERPLPPEILRMLALTENHIKGRRDKMQKKTLSSGRHDEDDVISTGILLQVANDNSKGGPTVLFSKLAGETATVGPWAKARGCKEDEEKGAGAVPDAPAYLQSAVGQLDDSDVVIILQSPTQRGLLARNGRLITIDGTHNTSK